MPEWQDPVGQLIDAFGQNPQHVAALLSFLTLLPEEVTSNTRIPMSVSRPISANPRRVI